MSLPVVSFLSSEPTLTKSIFVDHGPIAKPPLLWQMGTNATLSNPTDVQLPGGAFSSNVIGKSLVLTGTTQNTGSFLILSVLSVTRLRVRASFDLPDAANGSIDWSVVDPRDGEIADSPLDVIVRVNSVPVVPVAVAGLLGQIVLPSVPLSTDDVKVDYAWVDNPVVEIRQLNNPQFSLNATRRQDAKTQHVYRYQSVLMRPSDYLPATTVQSGTGATIDSTTETTLAGANLTGATVGMQVVLTGGVNTGTYTIASIAGGDTVTILEVLSYPDAGLYSWEVIDPNSDIEARLAPPVFRDIKYRAYERAYTPVLNDPNLLILNTPTQRIAYPPLSRQLPSTFIRYEAVVLPENDANAWSRVGLGSATIVGDTLVVTDNSTGPIPTGQQIYWTRPIDITFPHVFATAWRFRVDADPLLDGVFTGVAVGFSDAQRVLIVGYLDVSGVRKLGILKRGYGDNPSSVEAWGGGLDGSMSPTGSPVSFDWSVLHSYRIYQDPAGVVRVYVDGEIVESLRALESDLPFLEEMEGPFLSLQGVFFGSISRPAKNTSTWDFIRYEILPTNPVQSMPSSFVSYEATNVPEFSNPPWTPVGYHGTETIITSSALLLDSTSATTEAAESEVGLIGGDFRGYVRLEPLLSAASSVVLDFAVALRTFTQGVVPDALMAAIDDGSRLIQVCFFPDRESPKYSYGGRVLPELATPVAWSALGTQTAAMLGRVLRITDTSISDGLVYYVDDNVPDVITSTWMYEFRAQVQSYTPEPTTGFAGAFAQTYDGQKAVGVMFAETGLGVRQVVFHSDGTPITAFDFEWFDGAPHTVRVVVNVGADLVILFVDSDYIGTTAYSTFPNIALPPPPYPPPQYSWGSATPIGNATLSVVDWHYSNVWNVYEDPRRYVGVWKGTSTGDLTDYHLPLYASGRQVAVAGNGLEDLAADFVAAGVTTDDMLVIDDGPNKGVYEITALSPTTITVAVPGFPTGPTLVDYRIPKQIDWSTQHAYRIVRDPGGGIALLLDGNQDAILRLSYDQTTLPPSNAGILRTIGGGLPSIAFGAFDPTNLSQSAWDWVRYGIVRQPDAQALVPPHQVLNQRNVIASPEHLTSDIIHPHTDYWSSSTGIPPQTSPDFLRNPALIAYTRLNEGTPIVPLTQTSEIRHPVPVIQTLSGLNRPADVLNNNGGFLLNDPAFKIKLLVPDDVLYNSIQVIETTDGGVLNEIAPFYDRVSSLGTLSFQNEVCLTYDGSVLPQNDPNAVTPWTLESDSAGDVSTTAFSGILTYGTTGATRTIYRNPTPLPDTLMPTQITFNIRLLNDASAGLGDSGVRFGFSAPGLTLALGLITAASGDRYVYVIDMNTGTPVGGMRFDFLDGLFHTYRVIHDPSAGTVDLFIDS